MFVDAAVVTRKTLRRAPIRPTVTKKPTTSSASFVGTPKVVPPMTDAEKSSIAAEKQRLWAQYRRTVSSDGARPPTMQSSQAASRSAASPLRSLSAPLNVPVLIGVVCGVFFAGVAAFIVALVVMHHSNRTNSMSLLSGQEHAKSGRWTGAQLLTLFCIAAATVVLTLGAGLTYYFVSTMSTSPGVTSPAATGRLVTANTASISSALINSYRNRVNNFRGENQNWNPQPVPAISTDVQWDPTLAAYADQYIAGCPGGHSGGPYGENLYFSGGVQDEQTALNTAFQLWFDEYKLLNMRTNTCSGGWAKCGHFVQLAWSSLGLIGCSVNNQCTGRGNINGSPYSTIVSCNFRNGVLGLPNGQTYPPYAFPGSSPSAYQALPPRPPIGLPMPQQTFVGANPPAVGQRFNPIRPTRLLDTRDAGGAPVGSGNYITLVVAGRNGIPADASGALLNVVVVSPAAAGWALVWPAGEPMPLASNQNFAAGQTVAGLVFAKLGAGGAVNIAITSQAHFVVDASAFLSGTTGSLPSSLTPFRLYDSRNTGGPLAQGQPRSIPVTGVPAGSSALQINIAATQPVAGGWVALYPGPCSDYPGVSTINFNAGQTIANFAVVPLPASSELCAVASGPVHIVLDVTGYAHPTSGGVFFPITPQRIVDTRNGVAALAISGQLQAGTPLRIPLSGTAGTPADVKGIAVSLVVVDPAAAGYIVAWPCDQPMPGSSTVNFNAGEVRPNAVTVAVSGASKELCVQSSTRNHLVADLAGYFR